MATSQRPLNTPEYGEWTLSWEKPSPSRFNPLARSWWWSCRDAAGRCGARLTGGPSRLQKRCPSRFV